jgi:Kef-type K+ transport system membrane component KefB
MTSAEFVRLALQLAVMLGFAVLFGQVMRRFHQPAVLGEMLGGIILGPTIFGLIAPGAFEWLFQSSPGVAVVRDTAVKLGMLFFLFVAGLEIDLSDLRRLGRRAVMIGLVGTLVPIAAGVALVYALPRSFWGPVAEEHFFPFALFIGMNLGNSANPVLARILMDLGLLRSPIGSMSMAATVVDDLVNWTLFAVILSDISPSSATVSGASVPVSIALVLLLFVLILGVGRWVGPGTLHWLKGHVAWPSGFIAVTALFVLLAASLSEWLGVHAFLGAFLVGAALGGHDLEHREAHEAVTWFVLGFFAPIYFVSMGMTTDYIANFDAALVALIVLIAFASKLGGVLLGARLGGMPIDRDTWAIAFGLNARGATGIILASVGLSQGLIDERIFVGVVVMALITSLVAGPAMNRLLSDRMAHAHTPDRAVSDPAVRAPSG